MRETENKDLISILNHRASRDPDRLAYIFLKDGDGQEQRITYGQLARGSKTIAVQLRARCSPHSRALLLYPQGLEFIIAFLGCLMARVVAVPAYPPKANQKMSRLSAIVQDCQPRMILTTEFLAGGVKNKLGEEVNFSKVKLLATDAIGTSESISPLTDYITDNSLAFIQYTSGSEGRPKGVMIGHGNIAHNSLSIQKACELTEESISVTWLPNFHDMGLIDGIIQPLYTGFPGVIMPPESFLKKPVLWLQAITKYRGTHGGGPNLGYQVCVDKITPEQQETLNLTSWVSAYNGAEPVRKRTLEAFIAKFKSCGFSSRYFFPCYGMAEATLMITGCDFDDDVVYFNARKEPLTNKIVSPARVENEDDCVSVVSCGHGWLNTEIKIVEPEDFRECPENGVGEIWVRGPGVALGYWNQPQKTGETFGATLAGTDDKNYLRTGDLGFVHDGQLFITGRLKDLIIIGGRNHYPQDIEYSVQASHRALRFDCGAAFGVDIEDRERLVIVQEVERNYPVVANLKEIVLAVRKAISLHHGLQVHAILLIRTASVPKTSSGKIQRHACRMAFLEGNLPTIANWTQGDKL